MKYFIINVLGCAVLAIVLTIAFYLLGKPTSFYFTFLYVCGGDLTFHFTYELLNRLKTNKKKLNGKREM